MHRFTLILIATAAGASAVVWRNAGAQNELKARLSYGSDNFHRAQAKGQVAQLRNRLDRANALTTQQAQLMEQILIAERDRQEREVKEQYASRQRGRQLMDRHGDPAAAGRSTEGRRVLRRSAG